eukprot:GHVQ01025977.1.p1 GENE.GHVQ01025977.1~~GHVQ01025977.1.p1  ORF type:complete len:121 (-),score=33.84 GHVQ01025977.1:165-527(-)
MYVHIYIYICVLINIRDSYIQSMMIYITNVELQITRQTHTAAHSSTQQHTAAHSSTQQHTAAHSSTQTHPVIVIAAAQGCLPLDSPPAAKDSRHSILYTVTHKHTHTHIHTVIHRHTQAQ